MDSKAKISVAVIIPAYRVTSHIISLVENIGSEVSQIYIVDDCCPDGSGEFARKHLKDNRLRFIFNEQNEGVGKTVINGFLAARADGHHIGVKLDGDGQMDPSILSKFTDPIINKTADYTKGNRFFYPEDVQSMPFSRLVGNATLSFTNKLSTGYWNIFDPTNGYIAINLNILEYLSVEKISKRFFFETDMLFRCNLIRAKVVDVPMVAIYKDEQSNLKFFNEAPRFMGGHIRSFFKRIVYNYFLRDFNIASLELIVGLIGVIFGVIYGLLHFGGETAAPAGVVMTAAFPLLVGIMLLLGFLNYDMQQTPKEPIGGFFDR